MIILYTITVESASEKNCENLSIFDEVMSNNRVSCFFDKWGTCVLSVQKGKGYTLLYLI